MMTIKKANNYKDQVVCMKMDFILLLTITLKHNFVTSTNKKSGEDIFDFKLLETYAICKINKLFFNFFE